MLLEADVRGGDVAARFNLATEPGLASLSVAARRSTDASLVFEHVQELPGGLKVLLAPPPADRTAAAMKMLAEDGRPWLRAVAEQQDLAVVTDLGDLAPLGWGWAVAEAAEVLLLVVRPVLEELTRVISAAEALLARCEAAGTRLVLVTVGVGPFSKDEIEAETGIAVIAELPIDAAAAAMLAGRPDPRGILSRLAGGGGIAGLPLAKAAGALAATLATEQLRPGSVSDAEPQDAVADDGVESDRIGALA
ncbi:hypothetical protein [Catenulispora pinisilvae]|uniref:hypothetical protein n=1 Tax=Catenulispora pinisilvae TaxID=2705253 RepID=UPI0018912D20|nr:hypothetical protein [Catenulispora pinisilvae]